MKAHVMDITDILKSYRESVVGEWVRRLHTEVSSLYSAEKIETLNYTCSSAYDANFAAFARNDFSAIDVVIEYVGNLRGRGGFPLSDVQKAFEIYRSVLMPILVTQSDESALVDNLERLNFCFSYTIHKFSDYFQSLSEKQIRDYAQTLELKVEERTKEIAESEDKYRTLVEEMRDGYCVNEGGKIIYANRSYCEMYGYTLKEVVGRPYTDFIAAESLEEVTRLYDKRVAGSERKEQYTFFRLHKDGRSLPTENTVNVVRYQGRVVSLVTCCDVTERIRMEERFRETEQLAHIGHLTASLAHEIRNPLSAARMGVQMLLKNPVFTGINRRRLEILAHETLRLDGIVTDMLDFARPMKFEFRLCSMADVIQSSLEAVETRIREKYILIHTRSSRNLPFLMMDYEKMEQVVINLLLNSIEAVPDNGEIKITVGRQGSGAVRVQIADSGGGISGEDLPFIFDPFFSKRTKGTGLGLFNVKKIVEGHGGSIQAIPEIPHGVCMSFTIPREPNGKIRYDVSPKPGR
jgi:PAS domain S-box-containing protein